MSDERRTEDRAPITLKVDYKRMNTFFADYTKNISKGGTFIRTTKPLTIGTEFVFELSLPPTAQWSSTKLELVGVVKWVVPEADATEDAPAGMGIGFKFADDAQRKHIETFVADLMRDSLGPALAARLLGRDGGGGGGGGDSNDNK